MAGQKNSQSHFHISDICENALFDMRAQLSPLRLQVIFTSTCIRHLAVLSLQPTRQTWAMAVVQIQQSWKVSPNVSHT